MTCSEILTKVNELKHSGIRVVSNCFFVLNDDLLADIIYCSDNTVVFGISEESFSRIYFYTNNLDDLKTGLSGCETGSVLEIVGRNKEEYKETLESSGFDFDRSLVKMFTKDISSIFEEDGIASGYDTNKITLAEVEDLDEIYDLLYSTFDTRISHLPTRCELRSSIENKEISIVRNGNIVSLLQSVVEPKSFYFNQIINKGDKNEFREMVFSSLHKYISEGGKYSYSWVEENNIASLKFFKKLGFTEMSFWTNVYIKND